jgi:hypothetical protein
VGTPGLPPTPATEDGHLRANADVHAVPRLGDPSRDLVAKRGRVGQRQVTRHQVEVGVTQPTTGELDDDLAGTGFRSVERLDTEPLSGVEACGAHS